MTTRITSAFAALALLSACGTEQPAPTASASRARLEATANGASASDASFGPAVAKDLATLRQVTAPYHDFATGKDAGWGTQITGCRTDPGGAGGMGFHYGNTDFIDGTAQVDRPQLLLYEPESNGKLRLVAVEYIIPYTFHARSDAPPVLFGQQFKQVDAFQLWGLHAWVWKENPSGIFADWNPNVNCDDAPAESRMAMAH